MSIWPGNAKNENTTFGGLCRSELMSRVHSSGNATTETRMVNLLNETGLEGWEQRSSLLGKPDFIWPIEKVALFVDGCFWHGHNCKRNLTPKRNMAEWQEKIIRNKKRDRKVTRELKKQGWRVVRIWECRLAREPKRSVNRIKKALCKGLQAEISV